MKKSGILTLIHSAMMIGLSAAATVTISATAPTVDGADIANDNGTVDAGGDNGHIWSNRPFQGQTFTTGGNIAGYQLNALTLKNLNNTISNNPTFSVIFGSVTGSVMTQIGSTETAVAGNYQPLDYITYSFDIPIALNSNTTYGFLWGSQGSGFVTVNNFDGATFGGGAAISSGSGGVPDLGNVIDRGLDRVFHADIEVVPEPSTTLLGLLGIGVLMFRRRSQSS